MGGKGVGEKEKGGEKKKMQVGEARHGRQEPSSQDSEDTRNSMSAASADKKGAMAASSGDKKDGEVRLPRLDPNKRISPPENTPQQSAWAWPKEAIVQKGSKKGE